MKAIKVLTLVIFYIAFSAAVTFAQGSKEKVNTVEPNNDFLGINKTEWMDKDMDYSLGLMNKLGVKWIRYFIHWGEIEPSPGHYNWTGLDQMVDSAKRHGLRILVTLRASNRWAGRNVPKAQRASFRVAIAHSNVATPPKDWKEFSRFIKKLALRYKGQGICWQIENEPNLHDIYWWGTKEEYVHLLKAAYTAIHENDPDAIVLAAPLLVCFLLILTRLKRDWLILKVGLTLF
jgi:endo-1,4-beta-mannosidase